jgi:ABC-type Na+ transport system ATPase subunit NatA
MGRTEPSQAEGETTLQTSDEAAQASADHEVAEASADHEVADASADHEVAGASPGSPDNKAAHEAPAGPDAAPSVQERIYEWSTDLPLWQRDLLRRLTKGPLSTEEEDEVLAILLRADDAPSAQPLERGDLPAGEGEAGPVELREIRNVENVNLLAEGQALRFEPGLNVVFGGTGAGKSGYGRLLRRLCRPADGPELLCNAFDARSKDRPQTVVVQIATGDEAREISVDLTGSADRALSSMSVFDSARAPLCVSKPNVVEHVPEALLLLRRLAEAQEALQGRLKERIGVLQGELPIPGLDPWSDARGIVEGLSAETDPAAVERLATLTDEERTEMKQVDAALAALGSKDGQELAAVARSRAQAAENVAGTLEKASEMLSDAHLQAITDLHGRLEEATAAESSLAADAFSEQTHPGTGQEAWLEMWESARAFVEAEDGNFPAQDDEAACPLCQQGLGEETRQRMARFEEFARSDHREKVGALTAELSQALEGLPNVAVIETLVDASLSGAPDEVVAFAAKVVSAFSARVEFARSRQKASPEDLPPPPELPSIGPIHAYAEGQAMAAEAQTAAHDEASQRRLLDRRAELHGRDELAAVMPVVRKRVAALAKIACYKRAAGELKTSTISARLRSLQDGVVTDRLRTAIVDELKALDLLTAEIDVMGKAKGGRTAIEFKLRGSSEVKVGDVLSEGEQRALALAFFLAESSVSQGRSAIVLDDPVSLLDLERCEHVARRLVEEAQRRQVIVFTHDLAFVQMLKRAATATDQRLHGQVLQRAYGRVGIPGEDLSLPTATAAAQTAGEAIA